MASIVSRKGELIQDPPLIQKLLGDSRAGWIWLLPRLWLGYQWLEASAHKLTNPAWMQTGDALKGFWVGALTARVPRRARSFATLTEERR